MKKSLICMTAAAAMMFATVTSYCGYEDRENEGLPEGEPGFDAPANIGIMIIG